MDAESNEGIGFLRLEQGRCKMLLLSIVVILFQELVEHGEDFLVVQVP